MIKTKLLAAAIVLILVACLFSSCFGGGNITGTWKSEENNNLTITSKTTEYSHIQTESKAHGINLATP